MYNFVALVKLQGFGFKKNDQIGPHILYISMVEEKKEKKKKSNFISKIVIGLWIAFIGGIGVIALTFILIAVGAIGYMPPIEDLQNPIDKYASQVISSDGQVLGTFSLEKNNRLYSKYSDLPPHIVQALIATEDERFYSHSGLDLYALSRAVIKRGIFQDKSSGGGSTITQQLAKQLYSPPAESTIDRILQKPIEWVIAARLEKFYTKEEIVNLYLNQFDFLHNAVGIQSASHVYFNKAPKDLKLEESAMLVGMCKNPALYNPAKRPEKTQERRNVVLSQMVRSGYLTEAQKDSLKVLPIRLDFKKMDHNVGLAPYFREYLRKIMNAKKPNKSAYRGWEMEQYASDSVNWETNPLYGWVNKEQNRKPDGKPYSLGSDGLKIYTTIDSRMQQYAEESVREHFSNTLQPLFDKEKTGRAYAPYSYRMAKSVDQFLDKAMKQTDRYIKHKAQGLSESEIAKIFREPVEMKVFSWKGDVDTIMTPMDSIRYHKQFLRTGFMALENKTGYVRAYVGDIDYNYFKYDMVNLGRRQVGSTFKPFLYTLAMEEGTTPCDEMLHVEQTYYDENKRPWTPRNAGAKRVGEMVSIRWGLQNSSNWVTAYLMGRTSPYSLERLLRTFGITGKITPVISMCLGTDDISVSEMAGAYTAFANHGIRSNPIYVNRIEDQHGNIIATFVPRQQEVFSETGYVRMLDMLRAVMDGGTGGRVRRIYGINAPMGGKTGTTQENADGWFMGFTPSISTATWVGGEERDIHFDRMADGQGASMALPIFGLFMQKVYADPQLGYSKAEQFDQVPGIAVCPPRNEEEEHSISHPVIIDDIFN